MKIDLLHLLKSSNIFCSLDDSQLIELLTKFKKVYLNKNSFLYKQGDLSNSLYLLVTGKLAVFVKSGKNKRLLINEVLSGSIIGELTAISHEPRTTTAKAVKQSILLQLTSEDFVEICKKFSSVSLEVINTTLNNAGDLIKLMSNKIPFNKNIAIVPANTDTDLHYFKQSISQYIDVFKDIVLLNDWENETASKDTTAINRLIENANKSDKTIIYIISSYNSVLATYCFDHKRIDMIYIVGIGGSQPILSNETLKIINIHKYKIKPELILIYIEKINYPKHTAKWLKLFKFNLHHHIRIDNKSDWQRLLRFITGNVVGIVFSGGGLRCWAHLGALRAINRLNIPIDIVGGTSSGALVAAYYAMVLSLDDPLDLVELSKITRQVISFKNLTWPAASIYNAKDYTVMLRNIFKNHRIENLWLPCFSVSTNLAQNKQVISRKGYLWKIIRSSTSIPLVFPPVVINGQLYLDGGLLNNLPVDVMKKILSDRGKVIAIELTKYNEDKNRYNFPAILPLTLTMLAKTKLAYNNIKFPSLVDVFLKSLLAGSSAKQDENGMIADVLISPDLSKYSLLRVKNTDEDELIKIGFRSAIKKLLKSWSQ